MAVLSRRETTWLKAEAVDQAQSPYKGLSGSTRLYGERTFAVPSVDDEEEEDEVDASTDIAPGYPSVPSKAAIVKRSEIANRLVSLANNAAKSVGKAKLSADLQVLRRALAQARPELRALGTERDYLSIISLIESGLTNTDWKSLSAPRLKHLAESLAIGTSTQPLNYDMVIRQAKGLRARAIQTLPVFDIYGETEGKASEARDCSE
jgi:hypothetical protein